MRVKNWRRFQHYLHREPPWIKLHRSLLNDREWHELDPKAAKTLISIWLIASESEGELPEKEDLAFRLRLKIGELNPILADLAPWIEQDASTMLASCSQSADTETEKSKSREETTLSGKPDILAVDKKPDLKGQALEVLEFLNARTGRHYRPTPANLNLILARMKEGATVGECRAVIVRKCRDWLTDPKMAVYLRPATLFNATKFNSYVGEVGANG